MSRPRSGVFHELNQVADLYLKRTFDRNDATIRVRELSKLITEAKALPPSRDLHKQVKREAVLGKACYAIGLAHHFSFGIKSSDSKSRVKLRRSTVSGSTSSDGSASKESKDDDARSESESKHTVSENASEYMRFAAEESRYKDAISFLINHLNSPDKNSREKLLPVSLKQKEYQAARQELMEYRLTQQGFRGLGFFERLYHYSETKYQAVGFVIAVLNGNDSALALLKDEHYKALADDTLGDLVNKHLACLHPVIQGGVSRYKAAKKEVAKTVNNTAFIRTL